MSSPTSSLSRVIRFAEYEVDLATAEVRKNGFKLKLDGQPLQVLMSLLERPAQLVTREELKRSLWPAGTFVDFDRGINEAVKRLREALHDSAERPRFIETLKRRGYRFAYPLENEQPAPARRRWLPPVSLLIASVVVAIVAGWGVKSVRDTLGNRSAPVKIGSLAVLPVVNLSGDPEQTYFADGMTEALINELGKISNVRVISRQSVMQYKGTRKTIAEIAQELNVDAVVEGTLVRERDRVRVTAQLIQARPERHLWAERYDREFRSILMLQSEVARRIAIEIRAKLTVPQQAALPARQVNAESYEAYLKGQYFVDRTTHDGIHKSIDYFRQAVDIDPTYAPAWAGLADAYNRAAIRAYEPSKHAYPIAKAAASRALLLDDTLTEAHVLSGVIKFRFDWDWAGAERELIRAVALNPSSSRAHLGYSTFLLAVGRVDEAVAEAERALDLDPLTAQRYMDTGWKLFYAGRYDEAIVRTSRMLELMPDSAIGHVVLALSYAMKGMDDQAAAMCDKALALPADNDALRECGFVYARTGREQKARDLLRRLLLDPQVSPFQLAVVYDALGSRDDALRWLDRAAEMRSPQMCFLGVTPFSQRLREEPRFQDLLQRMNFPGGSPIAKVAMDVSSDDPQ